MKTIVLPYLLSALIASNSPDLALVSDRSSYSLQTRLDTNSVGMSFVSIPAGSYQMGASDSETEATVGEKPRHNVTLSKPFLMSQYEVTQAQWETVMGSSWVDLVRSNRIYTMPGMKDRVTNPTNPATVSWDDAQAFIKKLNAKEGHNRYRLPTEAEWEYACRANTTSAYFFGDNKDKLSDYAWYGQDFDTGSSHPVGKKKPNPWGLYDMYGNAWEWVQDFQSDTYYASSPDVDPAGPDSGTQHVVRGGSWHVTSGSWRSAFRKSYPTDYRGLSVGFRLVMEPAR